MQEEGARGEKGQKGQIWSCDERKGRRGHVTKRKGGAIGREEDGQDHVQDREEEQSQSQTASVSFRVRVRGWG